MPVPASWTAIVDAADDARRDADRILDRPDYQPSKVPRPFQGLVEWLGERLEPIARVVSDVLKDPITGSIALAVAAILIALAAAAAIRRRDRLAGRALVRHRDESVDPDALERASDEAERAGDFERALRLRFRAGLLRLDRAGIVGHVEGRPSGQVARLLRVPAFDDLASTFDEVVYGRRLASTEDVAEARVGWPVVMSEAKR